jgi:phosphoribosylaminoimidazolecarboxamide formyltransferase/IMP cyclohydrolase
MRALLSVFDKTGLESFAAGLVGLGVELIASGNTSRSLAEAAIPHQQVADVTGAPEMLGGRVKTLHPAIHGGILADRANPAHIEEIERQGIVPIDLVACNLYPFTSDPSVEMIDIGGPTMVRAAAKNHAGVTVVVRPEDYGLVLDELRRDGEVSEGTRRRLARAAFAHTAAYDAAIVAWFDADVVRDEAPGGEWMLPPSLHLTLERAELLRYGENPHQAGARYRRPGPATAWSDSLVQHGGVELSYLNLFDADAAWGLAHELLEIEDTGAAAVIVKHANPCGAAVAASIETAYSFAFEADPMSAFGGIVALTAPVEAALAELLLSNALADVVIAPGYSDEALALLSTKRKRSRLLAAPPPVRDELQVRQIEGAYLVQHRDRFVSRRDDWRVVTEAAPAEAQWRDVELAWRVCARTGSNAVVLASDGQVVGVGCGQQNRVEAAEIATRKAAGRAAGGVGASDAFFPFRDGLDAVVTAGVTVVIQPGGSLRDDEVIAAANEHGIAMVMTGERHFRH